MSIFENYLISSFQQANNIYLNSADLIERNANLISEHLAPEINQLLSSFSGGKRIRMGLVKLGYELAGGKECDDILQAGLAFDIFHSSILIHDDIIDKSPIRRGKPTSHVALGDNHYGMSQSICLGDLGFFIAQQLILETEFPEKLKNKATLLFNKTIMNTILGEMLDIKLPSLNERTEKDLLSILVHKTAHYTVCGPLCFGAILANGNMALIENLETFGLNIGIALQIKDDINGIFYSSVDTGKSDSTDIEEGKMTYLSLHALNNASTYQKEILNEFYGQGKVSDRGILEVRNVFKETGSLKYAYSQLDKFVGISKKIISKFPVNYQDMMHSLADYVYNYK